MQKKSEQWLEEFLWRGIENRTPEEIAAMRAACEKIVLEAEKRYSSSLLSVV